MSEKIKLHCSVCPVRYYCDFAFPVEAEECPLKRLVDKDA